MDAMKVNMKDALIESVCAAYEQVPEELPLSRDVHRHCCWLSSGETCEEQSRSVEKRAHWPVS